MTSTALNRPAGNMNSSARTHRFGDYSSAVGRTNGEEKTSQAANTFAQSYGAGSWQNGSGGIWGNSLGTTGFGNKREASRPRVEDESSFKGVSSLTASSEAENPWATQTNGPWNIDTTSPTSTSHSSSTSPVRHRSSIHAGASATMSLAEPQNTSPYLARQTIGHSLNRNQLKSNLDPLSGSFNYSTGNGQVSAYNDSVDLSVLRRGSTTNIDNPLPKYESRGSFSGFVNTQLPPSRDASLPPSRQSEHAPNNTGNGYFSSVTPAYSHSQNNSIHRPSITGRTPSYVQQSGGYNDHEQAHALEMNLAAMSVNDRASQNVFASSPTSETFASQMWKNGQNVPRGHTFQTDTSQNPFNQQMNIKSSRGVPRDSTSPGTDYRHTDISKYYSPDVLPSLDMERNLGGRAGFDVGREYPKQPFQQQYYPPPVFNTQFGDQPYLHQYDLRSQHQPSFRNGHNPYGYQIAMNQFSPGMNPPPRGPARGQQDIGHGVRSVLLEEFRSNSKSNKGYDLKDIYGHIVEFSGDQHGSRFIQQKLESANSDEKDQIFREIQSNALQLMTDVFGNYVIQKLFEHGNQVQKKILAESMRNHVNDLSVQMYGCRVVQKALEHVLDDQQVEIVKELQQDVLRCVKDQNGNHVVQKAIERVPAEHIQFILDAFRGQVHTLATHNYGCRVIQRMLEHCNQKDHAFLLDELFMCSTMLVTDQFGNYVIQHIIQSGKEEHKARIIKMVTSQVLTLCKHKFASNVVEKAIIFGTDEQRRSIVASMTAPNADGSSPLQLLMKDQYGNYVVQKLLAQLQGADRERFVEEIKPQMLQLKKYNYGKQIAAIEKQVFNEVTLADTSELSQTSAKQNGSAEVGSFVPTPSLTTQNSPRSSNTPSTSASTADGPTATKVGANDVKIVNA